MCGIFGYVGDETDTSRLTLDQLGIPHEILDRRALDEAMPQWQFEGVRYGLFNPDGGPLLAERILAGLAGWLDQHGVALRAGARVVANDAAVLTRYGRFLGPIADRIVARHANTAIAQRIREITNASFTSYLARTSACQ